MNLSESILKYMGMKIGRATVMADGTKINFMKKGLDVVGGSEYKQVVDGLAKIFTIGERGLVRKSNPSLRVGSLREDGYIRVTFNKEYFYEHVLVYALYHGKWPEYRLSHFDGDRSNNGLKNIIEEGETYIRMSKYLGVRYDPREDDWVCIAYDGFLRTHNLGHFQTEDEAALAYNEFNKRVNGTRVFLNEV